MKTELRLTLDKANEDAQLALDEVRKEARLVLDKANKDARRALLALDRAREDLHLANKSPKKFKAEYDALKSH